MFSFFLDRPKNLYEELGVLKNATMQEINKACDQLIVDITPKGLDQDDYEYLDPTAKKEVRSAVFTSKEKVEEARHLFTNAILRDIYDKTGMITTRAEFNQRGGQMPQSIRYLQALGNSMNLSFFFILIFVIIDKHVSIF
jgi:curved DNA-binding protein CbpA